MFEFRTWAQQYSLKKRKQLGLPINWQQNENFSHKEYPGSIEGIDQVGRELAHQGE